MLYSSKKTDRIAKKAPIILSILTLIIVGFIFFAGLIAAIAVPNFIRAKQAAQEKQKAGISQNTVGNISR